MYHIDPLYSPFIRSMCVVPFGLERAEQQVLHRRRRSAPVVLPTSSKRLFLFIFFVIGFSVPVNMHNFLSSNRVSSFFF